MSVTTQGAAFLSWVGQALVVGLGWYVVHALSANRDRQRARREAIVKSVDTLSEEVSALLLRARDYHSQARDVSGELQIKMALQDASIKVSGLGDIFPEASMVAQCRSLILGLRRAISGSHFEDEHIAPLPDGDTQYQVMAEAALELKRALVKIKNRQFV